MNFSQMNFSQMSSTPTATSTPKKALDPREEHGVLPVTASLLASSPVEKQSVMLYGLPASRVVVVGKVEAADETGTHVLYTVNDETGSVQVQNYQDFTDKATTGDCVRVVAEVRGSAGEVMLSAINLSVLPEAEAAAAMGFHRIQVVLAECQVAKASPKMELFTPEKVEAKAEVKAEAKVEVKAELASPAKGKMSEDVPQAIVDHLEKIGGDNRENHPGLLPAEIANALSLPIEQVKTTVAELLEDGTLVNTIDNDRVMAL
jgi:RPA family protein